MGGDREEFGMRGIPFRRSCRISFRANSNVVGQKSQLPTPSVAFSILLLLDATVGPRFGQGAAARSLLGRTLGGRDVSPLWAHLCKHLSKPQTRVAGPRAASTAP